MKIIPISISLILIITIMSGCIFDSDTNIQNDTSEDLNVPAWAINYSPTYKVGEHTYEFWINFPTVNPKAGQNVTHLPWILDDLKEKPVVFIVHKTGCVTCQPQADRVNALAKIYGEDAIFYDLDIPLGGITEIKAYETYYYDPNGPPNYIALTGVFTLINDGGEVKIGWHTWEGDVKDSLMEKWVKDAIYYYINSED